MSTSLGGLSSILGIVNNLPSFLSIMDKLFYFGICMSLGGLVMRGWKRYKNWSISLIGSVVSGVVIIIGGILLSQLIPLQLPFLEGILQALISAIILYTILALITGGVSMIGKYVTTEQYQELKKTLDSLKTEFIRLRAVLERKNIMPEKLNRKETEKKLNEFLEMKKIKQHETISSEEKEDMITFIIKDDKLNNYKAVFDAYTGENTSFMQVNLKIGQKISNAFRMIGQNPKALTGVLIATAFTLLMISLLNDASITKITERLSVLETGTGSQSINNLPTNYAINNTSCLTATDLLYVIGSESYSSLEMNVNVTGRLSQNLASINPNETIMSGMKATYQGSDYILALTSTMTQSEFQTAMQTYFQNNMLSIIQGSNIDFCAITYKGVTIDNLIHACSARLNDDTVCDCRKLNDVKQYCSIFSNILTNQINQQLNQLNGGTQGTQSQGINQLLGLLRQ